MLILISAAAASFGGKSGMAWMWSLLRNPRIPNSDLQMPDIERSWGWIGRCSDSRDRVYRTIGARHQFRQLESLR